jgi:hypothetical protein
MFTALIPARTACAPRGAHDLSFLSDVRVHCVLGECGFLGLVNVAIGNFADPTFPAPTLAVWETSRTRGLPCLPTRRRSAWPSRDDPEFVRIDRVAVPARRSKYPARSIRSMRRERLYWANSMARSSSNGRKPSLPARSTSNRTSYQTSGG